MAEKKIRMTLNLCENNLTKAQNFFDKYQLVSMLGDNEKKFYLGNKENKYCKFCRKSEPDVSFKKAAHVIPEFMGSHNLLSYFECDSCNSNFSKLEDSFSNFLGITRTISQIKGKKKRIPKYKDPRTGLEMTIGDTGIQMTSIEGTDVFNLDTENKSLTIKTKRPGYIPIHIPKLLIKIGFSMLREEELEDYEYTRRFIKDTEKEDHFKDFNLLKIFGYFIPGPPKFNKPFIQLYQKIDSDKTENIPKYQLLIYFANYQFQMTLPFGKPDDHLQGEKVNLPIAPLLIDNSHLIEFGKEKFLNLNLTSHEKKSGEEHNITFQFESYTNELINKKNTDDKSE